jgi:RNA polymerase sigma-70 factor (ECF subfamily)
MTGPFAEGRALGRAELEALLVPRLAQLRSWVRLRAGRELRAREGVSDILQSALREMVEQAGAVSFPSEAAFRRWVHQVVAHTIVSKSRYHAARKREAGRAEQLASRVFELPQREQSSIPASPSEHAVRAEDLELLERALAELDEEDREIVCLRRFFDVPTPEIATTIGMPESTVRWRLARAMAQLAARMR